jgi:hypothetical protein
MHNSLVCQSSARIIDIDFNDVTCSSFCFCEKIPLGPVFTVFIVEVSFHSGSVPVPETKVFGPLLWNVRELADNSILGAQV